MRVYKNKEELKGEIKKTYEKYILEFDSIPEDFKDKRYGEVDRTPAENLAYQVGWTTLILKWENDEKQEVSLGNSCGAPVFWDHAARLPCREPTA